MNYPNFHVTFCTYFKEKHHFDFFCETYEEYVLFCVHKGSFLYGLGEEPSCPAVNGDVVLCAPGQAFYRKVISTVSFCMIKFRADRMSCFEPGLIKVEELSRLLYDIEMLKESFFCTELAAAPMVRHFCDDIVYQGVAAAKEKDFPLGEAMDYIRRNYTAKLSVEELADGCGYSTVHFINLFKKYYGYTPKAYISLLRMDKARKLLANTKDTVGEIAAACGFSDALYFSRFFREQFQMSPAAYRKTVERNARV